MKHTRELTQRFKQDVVFGSDLIKWYIFIFNDKFNKWNPNFNTQKPKFLQWIFFYVKKWFKAVLEQYFYVSNINILRWFRKVRKHIRISFTYQKKTFSFLRKCHVKLKSTQEKIYNSMCITLKYNVTSLREFTLVYTFKLTFFRKNYLNWEIYQQTWLKLYEGVI